MKPRRAWASALLVAAGVGAAAAVLQARDATMRLTESRERLLYLTSGKIAQRLALSFDAVAADIYWIRTIQHYGRDRKSGRLSDRFALLQPLLDLTTTLDPHFVIAYRFGALFLAEPFPNGPGRLDQARALLEKGLTVEPARWQYAHDLGFLYYWHAADHREAARWFTRAANMPGAPLWLGPLAATSLVSGGDRQAARLLLRELETSEQPWMRATAARRLQQVAALDAIDELTARVAGFASARGRRPATWRELIAAGMLPGLPVDSASVPFVLDAATGTVSVSPASPLAPLPPGMNVGGAAPKK